MITVIIPAKNSAATIKECIQSVISCGYPNYEIIVVDGRSTDGTSSEARKTGVIVVEGNGKSRSEDCNIGIKLAIGEVIAFTDSDCIVDHEWLNRLNKMFADPSVGIAGGPDFTEHRRSRGVSLAEGLIHHFYRMLASRTGTDAIIGCNSAYRREAIMKAGGFDSSLPGAEDTELHSRIVGLGYKIRTDKECKVYKIRDYDLPSLAHHYCRYGRDMAIVNRRIGSLTRRRRLQIYSLLLGIIVVLLASLYDYRIFLAIGVTYAILNLLLYYRLTRQLGFGSGYWVFLVSSVVCMISYAYGFVKETVAPTH